MTSLKPRWSHASALLNTTLYITGGTTKDSTGLESILDETIALDFSQPWPIDRPMIFTTLPRLTMPLTGHSMSVVPKLNHLLVVGGESVGNQTADYVLLLDPLSTTSGGGGAGWRVPPIPTASSISSTTSKSPVATIPPTKPPSPVIPSPPTNNSQYLHRSYHAVITTGKDGVLLQGGYQTITTSGAGPPTGAAVLPANRTIPTIVSSLVTLNSSSGFAPQISASVSLAPNAPALARHTMTLTTDGYAIILGGINPQGILANLTSAHVMDTQSAEASWKEVPLSGKPPTPRMAFSTVMVNSTTLLLYGGTDDFKSAFWVTFYLDLPTWTWSSPIAQGMIPRRWGHTATMVGKTMVVMFGLSSRQTPDSTPVVLLDTTTNTWISRYTPSDQMINPSGNNNGSTTTDGGKKSGLSLIAVLGIGFVFTAGLVVGVFCLLVRQKKRRTRNTLARETMGHHVPRDAIRKQQRGGGANPSWGILGRATTWLGFGSSYGGNSGDRSRRPKSRRLSAVSPQAHPMSIAAQMTQLGHSPSSLGYPEMVVEQGIGMVPVSNYVYPNQPLANSESLARPAPAVTIMGRTMFAKARRNEEDGYGTLVIYHELSPAQKGALSLSQGKQASH